MPEGELAEELQQASDDQGHEACQSGRLPAVTGAGRSELVCPVAGVGRRVAGRVLVRRRGSGRGGVRTVVAVVGVRRRRLGLGLHDRCSVGRQGVLAGVAGRVHERDGRGLGVVVRLGPGRSRPVPALPESGDRLRERQRDGITAAALGLPLVGLVDDLGGRRIQRDLERRGVARDVLHHDGVDAFDSAELARLEAVQVRPLVVGEVLLDPVDEHLVDAAETVEQLEAGVAVDPVRPDGFGLDGDRRRGVVDLDLEGRARLVAGLVPRADLDLGANVAGQRGGVEGGVEHVCLVVPRAGELLPLPVDQLLDLHVGLQRVGLGLREVPGVCAADPLDGGRHVDDRLDRVQREGVRRLVAERVLQDEGVEALDCSERPGLDAVQVGPLVRGERLLDAVEGRLDDLRLVEELEAHLAVEAFLASLGLRLDRGGRAGGVQGEDDDRHVAGDVVDLEGVLTLDGSEHARLDPIEVTPDAVREILGHAVQYDLVDLPAVVQLEADVAEESVRPDGFGLDGDDRRLVVDGEVERLGRCHIAGEVQRVVAQVVLAVAEARQVDHELTRGTAGCGLGGQDDGTSRVADVADDLDQLGLVGRGDHEVDVRRVEDAGRGREARDRLLRVDDGRDGDRRVELLRFLLRRGCDGLGFRSVLLDNEVLRCRGVVGSGCFVRGFGTGLLGRLVGRRVRVRGGLGGVGRDEARRVRFGGGVVGHSCPHGGGHGQRHDHGDAGCGRCERRLTHVLSSDSVSMM